MVMIDFNHVSKGYQLGTFQMNLREMLSHRVKNIFSGQHVKKETPIFWAVDDVSFQVHQGEVLGIIGHNGAGKSTILKLLSKVTYPTGGQIQTHGRLASLIELGAGFHPELSGRENVYLNGSILGLKREEIDRQFTNIVEFAGLEKFIDTPIKRYSSGMYVRLAFSVASHVKADLLLIDEVLSVGDLDFQQKSLEKMNELKQNGTTIVFISHNLWTVGSFCDRAILLDHGKIHTEGNVKDVIQQYRRQEKENIGKSKEAHQEIKARPVQNSVEQASVSKFDFTILDDRDLPVSKVNSADKIKIRIKYEISGEILSPLILLRIWRLDGVVCCTLSSNRKSITQTSLAGQGTIEIIVGPLLLMPNDYTIEVQLLDKANPLLVYSVGPKQSFQVEGLLMDDMSGFYTPISTWDFLD